MFQRLAKLFSTFGLTAFGRVLGYGRDVALATAFGTSVVAELFVYAFRFQLFWRTLFVDQTLPAVLVPLFARAPKPTDAFDQACRLTTAIALWGGILLVLIQPLGIFLMARGLWLYPATPAHSALPVWLLAAGVGAGASAGLVGTAISGVQIARLQSLERFQQAAMVPLLFNGALLVVMALAALTWMLAESLILTTVVLGIGFAASGFVQTWVGDRLLADEGRRKGRVGLTIGGLRQALAPSSLRTRFTGVSLLRLFEPLPLILVSGIASVHTGFLTSFYLAERLTMLAPSILGLVLGAMLLSKISASFAVKDRRGALRHFAVAVMATGGIATLGAVVLWWLKAPVVALVFGHGAFDDQAVITLLGFLSPLLYYMPFAALEYVVVQAFITTNRSGLAVALGAMATGASVVLASLSDGSPQSYAWAYGGPAIARISLSLGLGWWLLALAPIQSSD